jgi:hypothetical protein
LRNKNTPTKAAAKTPTTLNAIVLTIPAMKGSISPRSGFRALIQFGAVLARFVHLGRMLVKWNEQHFGSSPPGLPGGVE